MHDETWRIDSSSSGGFRLLNHWWFIAYLEIKTIRIRGPWVQQDWDFDPSARAFSQIPCVPSWLLQEQPTLGRIFFSQAMSSLSRAAGQAYGPFAQKFLLQHHNCFGEKRPVHDVPTCPCWRGAVGGRKS